MDKCLKISVIPQFGGSCWFNGILMSTFYSQLLRQLMINKISKTWIDKRNSLFKFFKTILKYSYQTKDKKILKLFNTIKPDELLLKILHTFDKPLLNYLITTQPDIGWNATYISLFLKFLNVNTLDIIYVNDENILLNYNVISSSSIRHTAIIPPNFFVNNAIEINKAINNPDVIIIQHHKLFNELESDKYNTAIKNKAINKHFNSFNYNLTIDDFKSIDELQDEIVFKSIRYKLDSILISNFNKTNNGHIIAGITCNNNKYVYNGWNKQTTDPSFVPNDDYEVEPCKLMKFDWDIRNESEFCLNTKTCKLDEITDETKLCFSFHKGQRTLVYVRMADDEKESEILSSSFQEFSEKSKTQLKQEIDKLSEEEINKNINDSNKNKLPIEIKRKIVLYSTYDKFRMKHKNINVIISDYINKRYHINPVDYSDDTTININGKNYIADNLFYHYFILNISSTLEDIKNDRTAISINDLARIYKSQLIPNESLYMIIDNITQKFIYIKPIVNFDSVKLYIVNNKFLYKLFGLEFLSTYLTRQNKSLDELISYLIKLYEDSDDMQQQITVSDFNDLKILDYKIYSIDEIINFLRENFKQKGGKRKKRFLKKY